MPEFFTLIDWHFNNKSNFFTVDVLKCCYKCPILFEKSFSRFDFNFYGVLKY